MGRVVIVLHTYKEAADKSQRDSQRSLELCRLEYLVHSQVTDRYSMYTYVHIVTSIMLMLPTYVLVLSLITYVTTM